MVLADTREKPTGELRVTATTGLGAIWLTPRIREFIDLYPEIRMELKLYEDEGSTSRCARRTSPSGCGSRPRPI